VKEDLKIKNQLGVVDAVKIAREFLASPLRIPHAWIFSQGFGIGQEGIFLIPLRERFGRLPKRTFLLSKGLSRDHPHSINFYIKREKA